MLNGLLAIKFAHFQFEMSIEQIDPREKHRICFGRFCAWAAAESAVQQPPPAAAFCVGCR